MKFGERLKTARLLKKLTQAALAELVGVSQPTIWHLESPERDASGSEFTPRLARVLGISVDWLAEEIGLMIPILYSTSDPKIIATAKVMESSPEYIKDAAVKAVLASVEFAEQVKEAGRGNGTEG